MWNNCENHALLFPHIFLRFFPYFLGFFSTVLGVRWEKKVERELDRQKRIVYDENVPCKVGCVAADRRKRRKKAKYVAKKAESERG